VAVTYGWNKFKQDPGTWILLMVIAAVGGIVVSILSAVLRGSLSSGIVGLLLVTGITSILQWVISVTLQMPLYRAALAVTSGVRPTTDLLTNFDQLGPFLLTSLLIGVMVGVGTLFCVLPGVVLAFFSFLAPFFVLARGEQPVDAIKSSFKLINANLGPMAILALVGALLYVAGFVACLVGVLVTGPIVIIAAAYAFKAAQGELVAP
jgi:hypothetical protein